MARRSTMLSVAYSGARTAGTVFSFRRARRSTQDCAVRVPSNRRMAVSTPNGNGLTLHCWRCTKSQWASLRGSPIENADELSSSSAITLASYLWSIWGNRTFPRRYRHLTASKHGCRIGARKGLLHCNGGRTGAHPIANLLTHCSRSQSQGRPGLGGMPIGESWRR